VWVAKILQSISNLIPEEPKKLNWWYYHFPAEGSRVETKVNWGKIKEKDEISEKKFQRKLVDRSCVGGVEEGRWRERDRNIRCWGKIGVIKSETGSYRKES